MKQEAVVENAAVSLQKAVLNNLQHSAGNIRKAR